jgi:hypothetical protein
LSALASSGGVMGARARAAAAPATVAGGHSTAAELERLVALRDRGAITDEEYAAAKRALLSAG